MDQLTAGQARIGLVDDTPEYLELMAIHLGEKGIPIAVTGRTEESLEWVVNDEIDILVADMRMPEHGLRLAEKVQNLRPDVEVVMLTGFVPTDEEKKWAGKLGVVIYSKAALDDLIEYVMQAGSSSEAREARAARRRLRTLEYVHEQWTRDLINKLQEIPELQKAVISSAEGSFTIAQLIEDIRKLTPRGIKYIETWHQVMGTLLKLRRRR